MPGKIQQIKGYETAGVWINIGQGLKLETYGFCPSYAPFDLYRCFNASMRVVR